MVKEYLVGGFVRDLQISSIFGVPFSNKSDKDYAVEIDSFEEMKWWLLDEKHADIKVEAPKFFTIRASVNGEVNDYVMCRKECDYTDGRHPDVIIPGTINDDLARRDFTMNAIALDCETMKFIDPFNGIESIKSKQIRCVGNPFERMQEDYLRLLRALRFSVTLGFELDFSIFEILHDIHSQDKLIETVSEDRIREELNKMFKYNTYESLMLLGQFPRLGCKLFSNIWLKPTTEKRG